VSVFGSNCFGSGSSSNYPITIIPLPDPAGVISGNAEPCASSSATYSIGSITNATGYVWSVPPGATIVSGQNTTSINVIFQIL
jgi:hypothetical protein